MNIHKAKAPNQPPVSGDWICIHEPPAMAMFSPENGSVQVVVYHSFLRSPTVAQLHDSNFMRKQHDDLILFNKVDVPPKGTELNEQTVRKFVARALERRFDRRPRL